MSRSNCWRRLIPPSRGFVITYSGPGSDCSKALLWWGSRLGKIGTTRLPLLSSPPPTYNFFRYNSLVLFIERLTVLHEQIRDPARMRVMVPCARSGGYWTSGAMHLAPGAPKEWLPIYIARFPDGLLLLHDGHHRVLATYLAGRNWLHAKGYEVNERTYDDFLNPNLRTGWNTPLDPRTECRLADFWQFREEVRSLATADPEAALVFIQRNRSRYACRRTITRVSELAQRAGLTTSALPCQV